MRVLLAGSSCSSCGCVIKVCVCVWVVWNSRIHQSVFSCAWERLFKEKPSRETCWVSEKHNDRNDCCHSDKHKYPNTNTYMWAHTLWILNYTCNFPLILTYVEQFSHKCNWNHYNALCMLLQITLYILVFTFINPWLHYESTWLQLVVFWLKYVI